MYYKILRIEKGNCNKEPKEEGYLEEYTTVSFMSILTKEDITEAIYILNTLKKEIKED